MRVAFIFILVIVFWLASALWYVSDFASVPDAPPGSLRPCTCETELSSTVTPPSTPSPSVHAVEKTSSDLHPKALPAVPPPNPPTYPGVYESIDPVPRHERREIPHAPPTVIPRDKLRQRDDSVQRYSFGEEVPSTFPVIGLHETLNFTAGDQFFFFHVPKTAGMTFRNYFNAFMRAAEQYFAWDPKTPLKRCSVYCNCKRLVTLTAAKSNTRSYLPTCHFAIGHVDYSLLEVERHEYTNTGRRLFIGAVMRDPVKRLDSEYYFLKTRMRPPFDEHSNITVLEYATTWYSSFGWDNMLTKMFAGVVPGATMYAEDSYTAITAHGDEHLLEVAKRNMRSMYFIGLQEMYTESLDLLKRQLGWPDIAGEVRDTHVQKEGVKKPLSKEDYNAIAKVHHLDVRLFEFARELFEERVQEFKDVKLLPKVELPKSEDPMNRSGARRRPQLEN